MSEINDIRFDAYDRRRPLKGRNINDFVITKTDIEEVLTGEISSHTHPIADAGVSDGFMSSSDKTKLDSIESIRAITAATTIIATDYQINVTSGTFTQPLPTAVGISGKQYSIKNSGIGVVTISCNGAETIDDEATQTLYEGDNIMVKSTNSNWIII